MISANPHSSFSTLDRNILPSVFCARSLKEFRSLRAHSSNSSISEAVLADEVKFSPAFGDYLKVLESVQIDRRKNGSRDSVGGLSGIQRKKDIRVCRDLLKNGDREDEGEVELKEGWAGFGAGADVSKEGGILVLREKYKRNGHLRRHSERVFSKGPMVDSWVDDDDADADADDKDVSKEENLVRKERYEGNSSLRKHSGSVYSKDSMFSDSVDDGHREGGAIDDDVSNRKKILLKERSVENGPLRKHSEKIHSKASKSTKRDADDIHDSDVDDIDVRAAFKTFEVLTDVKNRPRVLRMELEERVQSLANRLNAADINMPDWKFSRMMHCEKIKFTDHSLLRVVQLLGKFGNWRRVLQVVEWFQLRQPFKSYKSRYIYTTVLNALGKARRPVEALNVFYSMRKELSSYPDLAAYHCIAVILGQAGMMKELFDVIDCMRSKPEYTAKLGILQKWDPCLEPDLVVFNAILNACVQEKQWEGAFWVLQELKKRGIKPTSTTYGLVMEVMLVCGKFNLVHEFFEKIQRTSVPGALNYKVLVNTFWREGKVDEAVLAVKQMDSRGIVGPASLYYDLARCLCSHGRCQEALQLIPKLSKVAQKPLVVTYTGLIQSCLDSGSIKNAAYVFHQMVNFCNPNLVTCNIMLKSYKENQMFTETRNLFQMILDGDDLIGRGKIIPDKFTFNTMLEACVDAERWDDFEYVYGKMLEYRIPFNVRRHLRMIMEASRAGKMQLLDITYHHLLEYGRTPHPAILKGRLSLGTS